MLLVFLNYLAHWLSSYTAVRYNKYYCKLQKYQAMKLTCMHGEKEWYHLLVIDSGRVSYKIKCSELYDFKIILQQKQSLHMKDRSVDQVL